jgi:hypothetical protein
MTDHKYYDPIKKKWLWLKVIKIPVLSNTQSLEWPKNGIRYRYSDEYTTTESATFVLLLGTGWFIFLYDERKRYNYYYATAPLFGFPNCRQDGTVALERISAVWFQ